MNCFKNSRFSKSPILILGGWNSSLITLYQMASTKFPNNFFLLKRVLARCALNSLLFKNIAYVGSIWHFVFVFVFKWTVNVMSQRAFQPYDRGDRPPFGNISYEGPDMTLGWIISLYSVLYTFLANERMDRRMDGRNTPSGGPQVNYAYAYTNDAHLTRTRHL